MSTAALERTTSGVEFLRRIAAGELAGVPIGDTLGFTLVEAEKGRGKLICHGTGSCLVLPR